MNILFLGCEKLDDSACFTKKQGFSLPHFFTKLLAFWHRHFLDLYKSAYKIDCNTLSDDLYAKLRAKVFFSVYLN